MLKNITWKQEIAVDIATTILNNQSYVSHWNLPQSEWTKLPDNTICPCYCNCRYLIANPDDSQKISQQLSALISSEFNNANLIVGLVTAGIPWAAWVAQHVALPLSYVRSSKKEYGMGGLVEGRPTKKSKAVLIDDACFTGESLLTAIHALEKEYEIEVIGVATIISLSSWECKENKWQELEDRNIQIKSLTDYVELLDSALDRQIIDETQVVQMKKYYESPKTYIWN